MFISTKTCIGILMALLLVLTANVPVFSETPSSTVVMVNNKVLNAVTKPVVSDGILLMPAEELAESLGGSFRFDFKYKEGRLTTLESELTYRLEENVACFNGKLMRAPSAMAVYSYRYMVPVEFSAQKLGAETYYSVKRNAVMIFQPVNGKIIYEVLPGDTLWIISQLFGTTVNSLKLNNSLSGDVIYAGQKLIIKQMAGTGAKIPAVISGGATLRSGAGFDYSISGYLAAGTAINITGKNGEWFRVQTPKGNGYLYYSVVSIKQDLTFNSSPSNWFSREIATDTTGDYVSYIDYTVVKGDYIWSLSQKFGIPDYELASANGISASTTLYPGQKLRVPVHNIGFKRTPGAAYGEILDWTSQAQYVFPIGKTGRLIDPVSGKGFYIKRTIGASHSDTETLTSEDSRIMKSIFGGTWSWNEKRMILETGGRKLAVSITGMPHAGVDGSPFLASVDNRSGNFGTGPNYDAISGNGMNGHFDMYFLNSKRHVDNRIDEVHQYNVLTSGGLR